MNILNFIGGPKAGVTMEWSDTPPREYYFPKFWDTVDISLQKKDVQSMIETYTATYKYKVVATGPRESFYRYVETSV